MKTTKRPWTEDELSVIADSSHLTAKQLADVLGRSKFSVHNARRRLAAGVVSSRSFWTADEDALILELGLGLTSEQLARRLPGRTTAAVMTRRNKLGVNATHLTHESSPYAVGTRKLLAKTCRKCGFLLAAERFHVNKKRGGTYLSNCKFCQTDAGRAWDARNVEKVREQQKLRSSKLDWVKLMDEVTLPTAYRNGHPYLESDMAILSDPTKSLLAKAIETQRTYNAVKRACQVRGFRSNAIRGGSRSDVAWLIDNPNADRIEEIAAMLATPKQLVPTRPAFEWDD